MSWTESVTEQEWKEWNALAMKVAKKREIGPTSLGHEDYAASAIEKLIQQPERPNNVEGWLTTVIKNAYFDRFRKIVARGGSSIRELTDEEWEAEMISFAVGGPSAGAIAKDEVEQALNLLSEREKELLILAAAGYSNAQIAIYLEYKTGKVVATRIKQINEKLKAILSQRRN